MNPLIQKILIALAAIVLIIILVIVIIYLWPLRSARYQTADIKTMTYEQSVARIAEINKTEVSQNVLPECTSKLLSHGDRTAKTVVMFHGVSACPDQFTALGKKFFDEGYNVYIPRAPYHGTADKKYHGNIEASDIISYANSSMNILSGLGDEVGVAGLSGGGMITTWISEYRPEVRHALILSPFYEPSAAQAPKWQLPLLNVLYGLHVLPDTFSVPSEPDGAAISYRALANYGIIVKNFKPNPNKLNVKSLSVIISGSDDQIDQKLGHAIPQKIAEANPNMTFTSQDLPADWNLGHDIVSPENKNVAARQEQLYDIYFNAYEGRKTDY